MDVSIRCGAREGDDCKHRSEGCAECGVRLFSVCAALDISELDELDALSHRQSYEPKAALFEQDDVVASVFNVSDGIVRLYKSLPDGRRQIVGFALPGDFLGLAMSERHGVTAEAVTPVRVCRFDRSQFTACLDRKPHLLRRLHEFAGHELSLAQDQMLLLGRRSADEKIAAFLLGLQTRLERIGRKSVTVPLLMSRQDIADHLGLTIETVSRTFSRLARDKIVLVVPDGVRLLDPQRLHSLASAAAVPV